MHEDQRAIGFIDGQEINVVEPEAVDVELAQRHGKDRPSAAAARPI
jgi:hypothetical protein